MTQMYTEEEWERIRLYTEEEWERIRREGREGSIYGIPFAVIRQLWEVAQARNISPAELIAEATATGPERDLADLERLAREHGWVSVRSVNVVREEGEDIRYEGEWNGCWRDCTRAEALALLKRAKHDAG